LAEVSIRESEEDDMGGNSTVTDAQIQFGKRLNLELGGKSVGVAYAMVGDAIQRSFFGKNDLGAPTTKQTELAAKFGIDIAQATRSVGDAVITDIMFKLNQEAIVEQKLAPGIKVVNKHDSLERVRTVSSIAEDGTVYFKGGNGARAWARSLVRIDKEK
jgi:hypothetical protein